MAAVRRVGPTQRSLRPRHWQGGCRAARSCPSRC
jgi:hypothetical protein